MLVNDPFYTQPKPGTSVTLRWLHCLQCTLDCQECTLVAESAL